MIGQGIDALPSGHRLNSLARRRVESEPSGLLKPHGAVRVVMVLPDAPGVAVFHLDLFAAPRCAEPVPSSGHRVRGKRPRWRDRR